MDFTAYCVFRKSTEGVFSYAIWNREYNGYKVRPSSHQHLRALQDGKALHREDAKNAKKDKIKRENKGRSSM
jgi:hypothetical protein